VPGAVLFREGSEEALTIAWAEAVADGPGWRIRFAEIGSREAADTLRGAYLETTIRPEADLARGEVYWHEVLGVAVRGVDGTELGVVKDIYRVAENEVYIVGGGAYGTFDVPAVRAFIRIFAPRRGEIVVDAEALDLQLPKERRADTDRPRAPRRTSRKRRPAANETSGETSSEGGIAADPATADPEAAAADRPEPAS
jgi:16S rRNA processing protein RimM